MKQKILIGLAVLTLCIYCSCNSTMKYDFEKERNEKLEKDSEELVMRRDPWDTIPSPMQWILSKDGTGPNQPSDPNYLYIGDEPDFKLGNAYSYYAHFYWHGFPTLPGSDLPQLITDYYMQIEWRYGDYGSWSYIQGNRGAYGLHNVHQTDGLDDISAFAFPYSDTWKFISIRMRAIHKDFLTSTPDLDADYDYLYDRSLVSPWSSITGSIAPYINHWGYGKPQPQPTGDNWSDGDPDNVAEGQTLVTVYFPTLTDFTFSYELINHSGSYIQTYTTTPNFLGIGKNKIMGVGLTGGTIDIYAKRVAKLTGEVKYSSRQMNYGTNERTVDVTFSNNEFED